MGVNFLEKMVEISPLITNSLVTRIYSILEEKIINMTLPPDTKLVEEDIAKVLGVSRSPVREALMRLENVGLVVRRGGKGRVVVSFTEEEVINSYEVREMIESFAGGLACLKAKEEDFNRIEKILKQMEAFSGGTKEAHTYFNLNYDFHYSLIAPCPNKLLLQMLENALKPIRWCWNLNMALEYGPPTSACDRHRALFNLYRTRDREAYEKLARIHIHDSAVEFRKKYASRKVKTDSL